MRKLIYIFFAILLITGMAYPQVTTLWEKSAGSTTLPSWFTTAGNTERGIGYGLVGSNHRLFIPSRNGAVGGKQVFIYNAVTGDSVGMLDTTGISGGTFVVNDAEVSSDGNIFVCNLTTSASTSPFKVYRYATEGSVPVAVINYTAVAAARLGDKFTVTGSTADNSIVIWAASANTQELYKFTTADNGASFTAEVLPLTGLTGAAFGSASVGPIPNSGFYWNAGGSNPKKYNADGTVIGTVPGTVVATGSNAIRYLGSLLGDEYVATYAYGSTNETGRIVRVVGGVPEQATLYGVTNILGTNANSGGTGDLAVRKIDNSNYHVYVLGTNNGFGAYNVHIQPSLAGDYYIGAAGTGPGGSDPQFENLRAAFDVLNDALFTNNCTFYITSNTTETHATGLGLAINPDPYTVTFKPYTGVQPVITLEYPTDVNSGPSGALIIGIPSAGNVAWNNLRATKNIVIDGSNTEGGTTRDLTIQNNLTSHRNSIPLVVVGDVSNLTVKNTNIYYRAQGVSTSGSLFVGAVMLRSRNYLDANWAPHDVLFENNHISSNFDGVVQSAQGYGTYQTGTPNVLDYPYNVTLKDNVIEGRRRGIGLYRGGSHNIFGNEITFNQTVNGALTNEGIIAVDVDTNSVFNIYNNKFTKIASIKDTTSSVGNTAIAIEGFGTYNVFNNMITGFELTGTNPNGYVRGIKNSFAAATLNAAYNTILMNDMVSVGAGSVAYQGFYLYDGTNNLTNNIIVNNETDLPSNCVYRTGTLGTVTSNYNNFYVASNIVGFVGYWNDAATGTLAQWQTASGQDANSVSKEVFFVSSTDLHLTGTSIGDVDLTGTPVEGITFDFDNETRSTQYPYMGADENSVEIPVELVSFSANVVDGLVQLTWKTVTEVNNKGFEVERKSGDSFEVIGFVSGKGTSTNPVNYSFVDNTAGTGKYSYRLKQIDLDGKVSYSNTVEVDLSVPFTFGLSQNYPNPFNPSTTINYQVAEPVNVTLTIYNTLGAEVAVLVNNQFTNPGQHSVQFDASKLASGTYIYRITAGKYVESKKMILMK